MAWIVWSIILPMVAAAGFVFARRAGRVESRHGDERQGTRSRSPDETAATSVKRAGRGIAVVALLAWGYSP
jgi:hypothetical protein